MKKIPYLFFAISCFFIVFKSQAQIEILSKSSYITNQNYLSVNSLNAFNSNYGDSLIGFDEENFKRDFLGKGLSMEEYVNHILYQKRKFINNKYGLSNSVNPNSFSNSQKTIGVGGIISNTPCVNEGFESSLAGAYTTSNAIAGWTVSSTFMSGCTQTNWSPGSSQFSIITTPYTGFPGIGTLPHSPFGGTKVALLNDFLNGNYSKTKISTTFPVTISNSLFQFAYAAYYQSLGSGCCTGTGAFSSLTDCSNNPIPCGALYLTPGCPGGPTNYTTVGGGAYSNWQIITYDLSPYIGTCVTFEFWCNDNATGGSYAAAAFDARCGSSPYVGVSYCQGSNMAQLTAPSNYASYNWISPSGSPSISPSQATLASITVTNPITASVYTVNLTSPNGGCIFQATYTISSSQISINNLISSPTCSVGTTGSATVSAIGSGNGYNYIWTNASNSVIGTSSVLTGVPPGVYSISVSAPNYSSCGIAASSVTVAIGNPPPNTITKPFCGSAAYLSSSSGSNFQWYAGTASISAPSGTAATYTVNGTVNNAIYRLGYNNLGCRDSTIFVLQSANAGTLSAQVSGGSCFGSLTASASINFTPTSGSTPSVVNNYSVISMGTLSPAYVFTVNSTATSFSASGLSAGYSYSVIAFDGSCFSGTIAYASPISPPFNFTINPSTGIICSGNSVTQNISLNIAAPLSQYAYTWTPSVFISTGANSQSVIISPTAVIGSTNAIIYTVVVSPTIANCPVTNTFQLITANPVQPTIMPVPTLCRNDGNYSIQTTPSGGSFGSFNGIITPSLTAIGTNTFIYSTSISSCVASALGSYTVYPNPSITVSGNFSVCLGSQLSLNAIGADTYLWSNLQTGPSFTAVPVITSSYSVIGTNTLGNCQSTMILTVSTKPLPNIQVNGNFTICTGQSTTLTASGANSYTWSTGVNNPILIVSPASSHTYIVNGLDALTNCQGSTSLSVIVDKCSDVKDNGSISLNTNIYPNPANALLMVDLSESGLTNFKYEIVNSLGQIVSEEIVLGQSAGINIGQLSEGVYILRILGSKGNYIDAARQDTQSSSFVINHSKRFVVKRQP